MPKKNNTPDTTPVVNFQKKLSTAKIVGKISARSVKVDESKDLYNIVGIASGTKSDISDFGPWTALTGNFAAVNLETSEQFRSGVAFLPDVALDPILGQLGAGAPAVEFGWVIGIQGDEDVQCGYTYYARPLVEANENDPLERLTSKMLATPALEDQSGKK